MAAPDTSGGAERGADCGFSLIEVIVSLAIVSLVSLAGFTLVDTLASLQSRIGARYDTLEDLQLILSDLTDDFAQADPASLSLGPAALTLHTQVCGAQGVITLSVSDGTLRRASEICQDGGTDLSPIESVRFTIIDSGMSEWTSWPADDALRARAVRVEIRLPPQPGALTGPVERLFDLPDGFDP